MYAGAVDGHTDQRSPSILAHHDTQAITIHTAFANVLRDYDDRVILFLKLCYVTTTEQKKRQAVKRRENNFRHRNNVHTILTL